MTIWIALETCPEKFRGPIGMGVGLPYSLGVAVFAGLGVFLRDWRHLYIATSFPALLLIPVAWYYGIQINILKIFFLKFFILGY